MFRQRWQHTKRLSAKDNNERKNFLSGEAVKKTTEKENLAKLRGLNCLFLPFQNGIAQF